VSIPAVCRNDWIISRAFSIWFRISSPAIWFPPR
jgi:hypothetical protein